MNIKVIFLLLSCLTFSSRLLGQEIESILKAPDNWNSEIIAFPLSFAPEIDLEGFEDIRFAPGWADPGSEEFWTYHFSWFVEDKGPMTEAKLSETFALYYDGLAKLVLKEEDSTLISKIQPSISLFIETERGFKGKIRVFDSFFTQDYLNLHMKVREKVCKASNKRILSFDVSPQNFDHEVWKIFQNIEIVRVCDF